ncbi:CD84 antigen [Sarotherodon galilaeus]
MWSQDEDEDVISPLSPVSPVASAPSSSRKRCLRHHSTLQSEPSHWSEQQAVRNISWQNTLGACPQCWRSGGVLTEYISSQKEVLMEREETRGYRRHSDEFLTLSANKLVKIIENDRLIVKQEKTVYEAVLRWIAFAPDQRREYMPLLLSKVRLALINPHYIMGILSGHEIVNRSKECRKILIRTVETMFDLKVSDHMLCNPLARPRLPSSIILAVGGCSKDSLINSIEAYNISANRWVNIPNVSEVLQAYQGVAFVDGQGSRVAPMHACWSYVSVTTMDRYIYAMGGFDGTNQLTAIASMHKRRSDASCTTLHHKVADQWTLIRRMGSRCSGLRVITFAGHVFAVGGFSGTACLQTVEAYHPDTNTCNFGISVMDDCLFVAGGYNGFTTTPNVEYYNLKTGAWSDACDSSVSVAETRRHDGNICS